MIKQDIKVLICDDSASIGVAIASALRDKGFFAYTRSRTENSVISSVISEHPDVVVTYLTLRDSDAVTLMGKVRELSVEAPEFIVISEMYNSFIEKQVLGNGAAYFISEPIDITELAEAVAAVAKCSPSQSCCNAEILVTDMIKKIGIPANLKGYRYVRCGVLDCLSDRSLLDSITKRLYPIIADKFVTTPARVERAIRTAIETAWERADKASIHSILGYTSSYFNERPTNSEFIAMLTDKLRLQINSALAIQPHFTSSDHISVSASPRAEERIVL